LIVLYGCPRPIADDQLFQTCHECGSLTRHDNYKKI
jgi:hypothetical protein